ncbi:LacI family DNA-binding transcriptional regulator [Gemmatimonas groenlandica]|uniref:LacI family DNA-binding transcriptional regulator n=1 Tax=Gemmatimonas groenlandica TaxID=2732249 RepID=A0A6M4IHR6_9BACT|nr:LacI family DNA-binding transcriptional regulator [Gemmatimonas groenlandica]QJR34644.1 LacI family DNA-binding transcriptional regulator [Gemmatimonas groenlandica]
MALPPSGRRVTIHDVAARAGVSQPTASLVLSNHPRARVAPATRQRVLDAAAELGYRPNVVAKSLASRRSFALGVIVPDVRNPFVADVITGAERVAADAGYAVLLCDQSARDVRQHLDVLRARQIDGVLLDAVGASTLPDEALAGVNVVLIDEPSERWPGIATDAVMAGRLAADHLLELGHTEMAFIGPASDVHAFRMRERGFVVRLREAGIAMRSARLRRAPATVAGGRDAMRLLLATGPRPTAVFCANDLMAIGALKQALTVGLSLPADLSVVGCDDIELARYVTPELTTISVPARELGARAARLLLQLIEQSTQRVSASRLLPVRLVTRGSSGRAPAAVA